MHQIDVQIDDVLMSGHPYAQPPDIKQMALLKILKTELGLACRRHAGYNNYIQRWPLDYRRVDRLADLPFLPVEALKVDPPLSLVSHDQIKRVMTSSATTSQLPSKVVLDSPTARRMTKGVVVIVRDFIGSARRPYLVVDTPSLIGEGIPMGARAAAIHGLRPFASDTTYCLSLNDKGDVTLDQDILATFAHKHRDVELLVYGFTFVLWNHLVKPLLAKGICLDLPKARVLHSGGWKRLQDQAVEKATFNYRLAQALGCSADRIVDFYGMVESVGVIFPDCSEGNKHAPAFGEVIVRDPLTLAPSAPGAHGIVQVCSVLPTSFPGNLLLTEDMAQVMANDGCPCGRRGISFRFAGRIPNAELRGCGNIQSKRSLIN